jgi:hypothetical protein
MNNKRELLIFEQDGQSNGKVHVSLYKTPARRFISSKSVDDAIRETRVILGTMGLSGRVRSININTDGDIQVVLQQKPTAAAKIHQWRYRQPCQQKQTY